MELLLAYIFIFHGAVNQTWALNILSPLSILLFPHLQC